MSEKNAYARKDTKKKTIRQNIGDSLKDTAKSVRNLVIAPKLRGEVRDAERDRLIDEATNDLKIRKNRK